MTSTAKLNEYNHAEEPARRLLEQLGWTYVPREVLASERGDEREVLLNESSEACAAAAQRVDDGGAGGAGHIQLGAH